MLNLERDQLRKTYEVSRMAFAVLSGALMLACFTALLPILANFYRDFVVQIAGSAWFRWIDVPITFGSLLGVMLLWGRFEHPGWQRRVGLLMIMSMVDVGLWYVDRGPELGLVAGNFAHRWLCENVGQALGWAEFALIAGLACDYLEHLGVDHARESGKSTRSMAATGAFIWLLLFCQRTNWWAGWPLIAHPRLRSVEEFLLYQASHLIWAITLIQVTSLVLSAARMSGETLQEMRAEDDANDPLKPRSEWSKELDMSGA